VRQNTYTITCASYMLVWRLLRCSLGGKWLHQLHARLFALLRTWMCHRLIEKLREEKHALTVVERCQYTTLCPTSLC
jgi:hypothetical protein